MSSEEPEWRDLVDLASGVVSDLREVFPEAARAWSELVRVFRRLLKDLPPLDKALLSVASDLKMEV